MAIGRNIPHRSEQPRGPLAGPDTRRPRPALAPRPACRRPGRLGWVSLLALVGPLGPASAVAAPPHNIKSHEYETERAGIRVALYEKWHAGDEKGWKSSGKVVLLVHGATWSSRCTFDPADDYSMMDALADRGFDVWALDLHGYGHSGQTTADWTESVSAVDDIGAAVDYIRGLRGVERVHLFGYQWGAQPVGLYAATHAGRVARVALFGMRYQLFDDKKKAAPTSQYRQNGNAVLKPEEGDFDPEFVRKRAQVCVQNDPRSPNGALLDLSQPSPVDPAHIKNPVLLIGGDKDGDAAALADRLDFFRALGTHNRWFIVLAGLGKFASYEKGRARFESALAAFYEQP